MLLLIMKPIQTSESPTDRSTSAALPSASPAFTLVEMVGVMAIVVLLAAAVLPSAINQLAYSAQSQETSAR
jgi:type II secretory pathway pseudopilin PulG